MLRHGVWVCVCHANFYTSRALDSHKRASGCGKKKAQTLTGKRAREQNSKAAHPPTDVQADADIHEFSNNGDFEDPHTCNQPETALTSVNTAENDEHSIEVMMENKWTCAEVDALFAAKDKHGLSVDNVSTSSCIDAENLALFLIIIAASVHDPARLSLGPCTASTSACHPAF